MLLQSPERLDGKTQRNPPKFQSTPERSGAKERAETLPPIRGLQEHKMHSHEHAGALRSISHVLRSTSHMLWSTCLIR